MLSQLSQQVRRINIRKPVHAAAIGLILAGITAPIAGWLITNERYHVSGQMAAVAERPSPLLQAKLKYDKSKQANIFNAEGQTDVQQSMKDKLAASLGSGDKKGKQLYTATMPDDAAKGIEVHDNVNDMSVTFKPEVGLMDGRNTGGRVSYPLKDQAGQMVFTPKGNGVKEDIVLTAAPKDDATEYHYQLDYPASVEARINDDGSVGFYTGTPELFGDISYGSDKDREMVETARKNAAKNYLMFSIPAPTVRETGKATGVAARFALEGKKLTVRASGLKKASYPLSIDPTFLISSATEFVLGSIDDNIDLSTAGQVGRQALVGGSTPGWTANAAPNLTYAQFASSLVAYNGYLYLIGGGSGNGSSGTTTNDVRYICLNPSTGALGTNGGCTPTAWTTTSSLLTARQGLVAFGFNGYLYAVGGEDNSGVPLTAGNSVEYAQITSTGALATNSGCGTGWCHGSNLNTVRSYPAGAIYQGVLYVMGGTSGTNNATPLSTMEYARINGDGTVGSWTQSSSLATGNLVDSVGTTAQARSKFRAGAYNGFLYVTGGQTATSPNTAVLNLTQYAPINSDGSVGAWKNTTAFPTARRDHGMAINNGYIYVFGGCSGATQACTAFISDNQYAVINADGTVGQWQRTLHYNSGTNDAVADYNSRMPAGVTAYSNHVYFIGGCSAETATNNCATQLVGTFITNIDAVGRFDHGIQTVQTTAPFNNNTAGTARGNAKAVALNGYLYYISGNASTGGTTYSTEVNYALINNDGTLGTFNTTATLPSVDGNVGGRIGHSVVAYNDKIYVIGGLELSGAGADNFVGTILVATPATNGTISAWTNETTLGGNSLPAIRGFHTSFIWHNNVYVLGGQDGTNVLATVIYAPISSTGVIGTWSSTNSFTTARWAHSTAIWGNWVYVAGGETALTSTLTTSVQRGTIASNGTITWTADTAIPASQRMAVAYAHNGFIYLLSGYNATPAAQRTIYWASLNSSTGAIASWNSTTNIGNYPGQTQGLQTARGQATGAAVGGYFYVMGGCTGATANNTYDACTGFINTVEGYVVNNGGTGQTSAFSSDTALSAATADHATVAYNGFLYQVGGCTGYTSGVCTSGQNSSVVRAATIDPSGSLSSWTTTGMTALPAGRSLIQAAAYNNYLYILGGRDDSTAAVSTVTYAPISSTGTIGAWSNADLPAGAARNAFGAAISNGYIYVAGGDNGSGTKKSDVYYSLINTDGSLAEPTAGCGSGNPWCLNANSFTTARSNLSLVAYNGRLYVIGGNDGTNTLKDVQFANQSSSDGSIGTWAYTTDVSRGMSFRQAVAANGYMYFVGNEGDETQVNYVDINADGTLGLTYQSTNKLAGGHAHGAVSWADGFFYVTGGCTLTGGVCTTGGLLTSTERAGQQAVSRTGHYSKLFNTQVDTSPTQLVINGAIGGPGSAVEFKFQTASSSDPVLGIAQLIRPVIFGNFYNVQALDSSGNNVGVAFNYQYVMALDDSRSGTFPDTAKSGFSQTAVTDITLYYHANPARRLRHGASFTDSGCTTATAGPTEGCILDTAP